MPSGGRVATGESWFSENDFRENHDVSCMGMQAVGVNNHVRSKVRTPGHTEDPWHMEAGSTTPLRLHLLSGLAESCYFSSNSSSLLCF